jgi:hypothetical protein
LIGDAELAGKWTDADREKMRPVLAASDDEARLALMRELSVAVNEGRIKLALQGPPLF